MIGRLREDRWEWERTAVYSDVQDEHKQKPNEEKKFGEKKMLIKTKRIK